MTWARMSSVFVAIAVALVIIANTPAILTDVLHTAVAQIRSNAAITQPATVRLEESPDSGIPTVGTSVKKKLNQQ